MEQEEAGRQRPASSSDRLRRFDLIIDLHFLEKELGWSAENVRRDQRLAERVPIAQVEARVRWLIAKMAARSVRAADNPGGAGPVVADVDDMGAVGPG